MDVVREAVPENARPAVGGAVFVVRYVENSGSIVFIALGSLTAISLDQAHSEHSAPEFANLDLAQSPFEPATKKAAALSP